jgi:hypothetical protein
MKLLSIYLNLLNSFTLPDISNEILRYTVNIEILQELITYNSVILANIHTRSEIIIKIKNNQYIIGYYRKGLGLLYNITQLDLFEIIGVNSKRLLPIYGLYDMSPTRKYHVIEYNTFCNILKKYINYEFLY